jgi:hypothetical protein
MLAEVENDIDLHFEDRRRNLYEISTTADQCEKCIAAGREHCWRKNLDYSGYYTQSYCCGPSDYVCK